MAIEKKRNNFLTRWIFDFFGGPGNKLKKKAIAPHCNWRFYSLGSNDFGLSEQFKCTCPPPSHVNAW